MTALVRWLLVLTSGAVWGLCFAKQPWSWAAWVALVPLLLALERPRAWFPGWVHGLVFWLVSIPWIVPTLRSYGQLSLPLALLSLVLLASYLALFTAVFAWLARGVWRRGIILSLVGLPALWTTLEWVRGQLFTGFPWNLAAYAWIEVPGALELSAWVGPWGVTYLLLFANTAVAVGVRRSSWRATALAFGLVLLSLGAAWRWGGARAQPAGSPAPISVHVLQPNLGILTEWDPQQVETQYRRMLDLSAASCSRPGELVIWPESAAWPYSYSRDERLRRDLDELVRLGCPLLVNTSIDGSGGTFNSVLLVGEDGVEGRYDKRHLVPFGEYVPLSGLFPFLDKIARLAGDFLRGERIGLLPWRGQRLAPAICFEITFPGEVAAKVRSGGTILVTVTNDAWYGDSSAPWQHFRAARFRAAENRRFLLRAALTGVSAIVRPDGSLQASLNVGENGVLSTAVPGSTGLSAYTRAPWAVPALCSLISVFAILLSRKERTP